jgi:hypothetical protein
MLECLSLPFVLAGRLTKRNPSAPRADGRNSAKYILNILTTNTKHDHRPFIAMWAP